MVDQKEYQKNYQKKWRETHKDYHKKWFKKNADRYKKRQRNDFLVKNYHITDDQYNQLFIEQNGQCKICNRHQSEFKRRLAVDHSHKTDEVRGLLCHRCNQGLGNFREDISVMEKAILYIKESTH